MLGKKNEKKKKTTNKSYNKTWGDKAERISERWDI